MPQCACQLFVDDREGCSIDLDPDIAEFVRSERHGVGASQKGQRSKPLRGCPGCLHSLRDEEVFASA